MTVCNVESGFAGLEEIKMLLHHYFMGSASTFRVIFEEIFYSIMILQARLK